MPLMIRFIKTSLKLGFITLSFFTISHLCKKATHGFSELSITGPLEPGLSDLPASLKDLSRQKFYYLGKGAQAFAFQSEDGQYVIKFLRFDHLKPKPLVRILSFLNTDYVKTRCEKSEREIKELLSSFDLARHHLAEETEVLHFQKQALKHPLTCFDKIGCVHKMSKAPFIVQKFARSIESQVDTLTQAELESIIDQLACLTRKRMQAGIRDKDPNLLTNFGFQDGKLVEFDIGRFYKTEIYTHDAIKQDELKRISSALFDKFPKLKDYFENQSFEL